jgi:hypothetical protein
LSDRLGALLRDAAIDGRYYGARTGDLAPSILQSHPIVKASSRQFKRVSQKNDEKLPEALGTQPLGRFAFAQGAANMNIIVLL